jgi:hypothetical protein
MGLRVKLRYERERRHTKQGKKIETRGRKLATRKRGKFKRKVRQRTVVFPLTFPFFELCSVVSTFSFISSVHLPNKSCRLSFYFLIFLICSGVSLSSLSFLFSHNISVVTLLSKKFSNNCCQYSSRTVLSLKMEPISCPETSVTKYYPMSLISTISQQRATLLSNSTTSSPLYAAVVLKVVTN